ncbi:MAG: hypothetical protein A2Y24_05530 [Clostridiales bacterium GWE2_32_10]|nr:MAG: hypothetical protein A2Y24_05530 [Clostridiales bacterium GWE2_32_10]
MELKRYESYIFEKLEKVDSMYRNAKRQAEALSKKDTQKFLLLVQKREVIIKDIENIDNVLNSNELPKSLKCESVLKEINEKYKKIKELNDDNMDIANKLKIDFEKRIHLMKLNKDAMDKGYNAQAQYVKGAYFDKKIGK